MLNEYHKKNGKANPNQPTPTPLLLGGGYICLAIIYVVLERGGANHFSFGYHLTMQDVDTTQQQLLQVLRG